MTPKEAFEHIKALWWKAESIEPELSGIYVRCSNGGHLKFDGLNTIDWGDLTQYPLPEPKWRNAVWPRDAANPPKRARFKNVSRSDWDEGFLVGYDFALSHCWINQGGGRYDRCQVTDEPRSVDNEIQIY